jgi:hypothetical protein
MLTKFSMIDEMLHEVHIRKNSTMIWKYLRELHETSDKVKVLLLKNILFSFMMDENALTREHLLKIKDIREWLSTISYMLGFHKIKESIRLKEN